jgi:hypothetical protein
MNLSSRVLGVTAVAQLTARDRDAVLTIGRDHFTRADLSRVRCFNFIAAQRLAAALATMRVKDTADVYARIGPSALAVPTIGAIAIAVLGAAFEARGIGGDAPLESWVERHATKEHPDITTFTTIKKQRETAARKRRGKPHTRRASAPHRVEPPPRAARTAHVTH